MNDFEQQLICNEVKSFINHRFSNDCNWTTGNCYWFSVILCKRFEAFNPEMFYDPIVGHFVTKIQGDYYDWNGKYTQNLEMLISFNKLKKDDWSWYYRIMKDCTE